MLATVPSALEKVRGATPPGTVGELQQKHLLALNLRQADGAHLFTPRAYYLPHGCLPGVGIAAASETSHDTKELPGDAYSEKEHFINDFMLSKAIAILQYCSDPVSRHKVSQKAVSCACDLCRRYIEDGKLQRVNQSVLEVMTESEGAVEIEGALDGDEHEEVAYLLGELHKACPELQLGLLTNNVWILKPATGAMGRGIAFVVGIDKNREPVVISEGHKREKNNGDVLGYIIQKYIERPHLIDRSRLEESFAAVDGERLGHGTHHLQTNSQALHKYNIRFWLEILWSSSAPEAWLYQSGYVNLADSPYVDDLSIQTAHVTNLSLLPAAGATLPLPYPASTEAYRQYLRNEHGVDVYTDHIMPQIRLAISKALSCIKPLESPSERTSGEKKARWKRFGLDFAVDDNLCVWLIEFNHNPGMSASRGRSGDLKRQMVKLFYQNEQELRILRGGMHECENNPDGHQIESSESCSVEQLCGFEQLEIDSWSRVANESQTS